MEVVDQVGAGMHDDRAEHRQQQPQHVDRVTVVHAGSQADEHRHHGDGDELRARGGDPVQRRAGRGRDGDRHRTDSRTGGTPRASGRSRPKSARAPAARAACAAD
ncbi:MAG: hypothetical protein MUC68_18360 [Burkholderiaceae bacterium]|nr:hypothetical protein [Burkholderiaceae bacterium]